MYTYSKLLVTHVGIAPLTYHIRQHHMVLDKLWEPIPPQTAGSLAEPDTTHCEKCPSPLQALLHAHSAFLVPLLCSHEAPPTRDENWGTEGERQRWKKERGRKRWGKENERERAREREWPYDTNLAQLDTAHFLMWQGLLYLRHAVPKDASLFFIK